MCNDAIIFRGAQRIECGNQGELASALRVSLAEVPLDKGYENCSRAQNVCLCPIDIEGLARRLGLRCEPPDYADGSDHWDAWALRERRATS